MSAQQAELEVLARTARENRVLVSHDRRTMLDHFRNCLAAGKSSPGILVASQGAPIGLVVEAIVLAWSISDPADCEIRPTTLPRYRFSCFRVDLPRRSQPSLVCIWLHPLAILDLPIRSNQIHRPLFHKPRVLTIHRNLLPLIHNQRITGTPSTCGTSDASPRSPGLMPNTAAFFWWISGQ